MALKQRGEWGCGELSESIRKERFVTKTFFSDNIESGERSGGCILPSKFGNKMEKGHVYLFDFILYSIHLVIVH